jgi:hypothetical protein
MTMQQPTAPILDNTAILERQKALAVRNAYLALLRAFEDMYDLPRSIPTKVERGERDPKQGHHNR